MSPPATARMAVDTSTCTTTNKEETDWEAHRVNLFLHAENVRIFDTQSDRQLPVTLVSGSLGSGKTTLLRHILTNQSNLRIAAAINDFAELNLDQNLIRHNATGTPTRIVALSNGCVCCHLLDDLQTAVGNLLGVDNNNSNSDWELDAINYLVIETSGVSDPTRIIRMLDAKFGKCFRARLDSVVVVVDTDQLLASLVSADNNNNNNNNNTSTNPTTVAQLQCADVILLNKTDLLENPIQDMVVVQDYLRTINDQAKIYKTRHCKIPLSAILDVQIPSTTTTTKTLVEEATSPITHEASNVPIYISATGGALRSSASLALDADDFVSLSETLADRPLSLHQLQRFLTSPAVQRLDRMKGVVWIQGLESHRCILHLSGRGRLGFHLDGPWTGPPTSEIVLIGRRSSTSPSFLDTDGIRKELGDCRIGDDEEDTLPANQNNDDSGLEVLRTNPEFVLVDHPRQSASSGGRSLIYFRLTGSNVYGYTEDEIGRDLRVDSNAMNLDLVNVINVGLDQPKAFLAYTLMPSDDGRTRVVLCYTGMGQPANNAQVLVREAKAVLATHFRHVQVCKCGI